MSPALATTSLLRQRAGVPLGLHRLDLLEQQFEPIEFTADLRLQVSRQQATIAGLELIQPLPPVAAQRLVVRISPGRTAAP